MVIIIILLPLNDNFILTQILISKYNDLTLGEVSKPDRLFMSIFNLFSAACSTPACRISLELFLLGQWDHKGM
jgi:hypothetical protein